jgi:hypothetical protein
MLIKILMRILKTNEGAGLRDLYEVVNCCIRTNKKYAIPEYQVKALHSFWV